MNKAGVWLTSLGMSAIMALSGVGTLKKAYAADNANYKYKYDIDYVYDPSAVEIKDNYDEDLMNKYRMASDDDVVEISDAISLQVHSFLEKDISEAITVGALRSLKDISIVYRGEKDVDLSFLNYCDSLETCSLSGEPVIDSLDDILELDKVEYLSLESLSKDTFPVQKLGFLNHCSSLTELSLAGVAFEGLEGLSHNIKKLKIWAMDGGNVDFRSLDFLDELSIEGYLYDIAITLSNDDIAYLEDKGVNLTFSESLQHFTREELHDVNDKLDEIVDSLELSDDATDEEKINAVLLYVLSNLTYDPEVADNNKWNPSYNKFYVDGDLYACFEMDTQICGNYAALMTALLHRVGVNSFVINSDDHAWNLVEVNGEYYYYDPTFLEHEQPIIDREKGMEEGNDGIFFMSTEDILLSNPKYIDQLDYYKFSPDGTPREQQYGLGPHKAVNFPFSIVRVQDESTNSNINEDINNSSSNNNNNNASQSYSNIGEIDVGIEAERSFEHQEFDIIIGNKKIRCIGAVVMGIMTALGLAKVTNRRMSKANVLEEINKMMALNDNCNDNDNDYSYG